MSKEEYNKPVFSAVLDKDGLKSIIRSKNMNFSELHRAIEEKYKLGISYRGFMALINNDSSWKLIYALSIINILNIKDINSIFKIEKTE